MTPRPSAEYRRTCCGSRVVSQAGFPPFPCLFSHASKQLCSLPHIRVRLPVLLPRHRQSSLEACGREKPRWQGAHSRRGRRAGGLVGGVFAGLAVVRCWLLCLPRGPGRALTLTPDLDDIGTEFVWFSRRRAPRCRGIDSSGTGAAIDGLNWSRGLSSSMVGGSGSGSGFARDGIKFWELGIFRAFLAAGREDCRLCGPTTGFQSPVPLPVGRWPAAAAAAASRFPSRPGTARADCQAP